MRDSSLRSSPLVEALLERPAEGDRDAAGLLAHHHHRGVGLLGEPERGAMARAERRRATRGFAESGRMHAAATTASSRRMTAPSCSGEPGENSVTSSSAVTLASSRVPVSTKFRSPVLRSITSSAPWRRLPSVSAAAHHLAQHAVGVAAQERAEVARAAELGEHVAQLGLEQDDEGDQPDRLDAVEDPLDRDQVEGAGEQAHQHDEQQADVHLRRARALHQRRAGGRRAARPGRCRAGRAAGSGGRASWSLAPGRGRAGE